MRRVLGIDPGALRLGWAVAEEDHGVFSYITSGILGLAREDGEDYQSYRDRLRDYWIIEAPRLLNEFKPHFVASEVLPAKGGGNFVVATQSELAKVAMLIIEVEAIRAGLTVQRIPANTLKKWLTGNGRATKVGVRNAVVEQFPELLPRKRDLTIFADESDALGTALVALGYRHPGANRKR